MIIGNTLYDLHKLAVDDDKDVIVISHEQHSSAEIISSGLIQDLKLNVTMNPLGDWLVKRVKMPFTFYINYKLREILNTEDYFAGHEHVINIPEDMPVHLSTVYTVMKNIGLKASVSRQPRSLTIMKLDKAIIPYWLQQVIKGESVTHTLSDDEWDHESQIRYIHKKAAKHQCKVSLSDIHNCEVTITPVAIRNNKVSFRSHLTSFVMSIPLGGSAVLPNEIKEMKSDAVLRMTLSKLPILTAYRKGVVTRYQYRTMNQGDDVIVINGTQTLATLSNTTVNELADLHRGSALHRIIDMQLLKYGITSKDAGVPSL